MTRPIFPNITDSRDDAERSFWARQNPGRWGRPVPPHGFDLKCGHCVEGHRLPGRASWTWPDRLGGPTSAVCECETVLSGVDILDVWADHVREVRA